MTHRLAIGVAICSMAMALFSVAVAQEHTPTPAEAGVLGLLETKAAASGQNLVLVDHVTLGALKDEGFERLSFDINPKKAYVVIGVCEETSTNLDISVYDGNDDIIDADFEPDASPVIFLEAGVNRTAKVKLFIGMKLCSVAPCVYGVGLCEVRKH
ncbi:MAG: hypothetical protein ABMA14_05315 [Hyphomonadaceae bacterium]